MLQVTPNGPWGKDVHPNMPVALQRARSRPASLLPGRRERGPPSRQGSVRCGDARSLGSEQHAVARCATSRPRSAPQVEIGLTTGEWIVPDLADRIAMIREWEGVDCATVNLSEPGFESVMETMLVVGVGIDVGLWAPVELDRLLGSGLLPQAQRVSIELGPGEPYFLDGEPSDARAAGERRARPRRVDLPAPHPRDAGLDLALGGGRLPPRTRHPGRVRGLRPACRTAAGRAATPSLVEAAVVLRSRLRFVAAAALRRVSARTASCSRRRRRAGSRRPGPAAGRASAAKVSVQQPHVAGAGQPGDLVAGQHPRHGGPDPLRLRPAARTRSRSAARHGPRPRRRPASCAERSALMIIRPASCRWTSVDQRVVVRAVRRVAGQPVVQRGQHGGEVEAPQRLQVRRRRLAAVPGDADRGHHALVASPQRGLAASRPSAVQRSSSARSPTACSCSRSTLSVCSRSSDSLICAQAASRSRSWVLVARKTRSRICGIHGP